MNVDTGHLMRLSKEQNVPTAYIPVPEHLNQAAQQKLNSKDEAMVSLSSGGKLSKWARVQRKNKRKQATESRRRNR